jgi:hypothetical protein
MPVKEVERAVLKRALEELTFRDRLRENGSAMPSRDTGSNPAKLDRPQSRPAAF